jgi:hypothetical protein
MFVIDRDQALFAEFVATIGTRAQLQMYAKECGTVLNNNPESTTPLLLAEFQ